VLLWLLVLLTESRKGGGSAARRRCANARAQHDARLLCPRGLGLAPEPPSPSLGGVFVSLQCICRTPVSVQHCSEVALPHLGQMQHSCWLYKLPRELKYNDTTLQSSDLARWGL